MIKEMYYETRRLYLRLYQDIDFKRFQALFTNPDVASNLGAMFFLKQSYFIRNFLTQMGTQDRKDKSWLLYSIFSKETSELIGGCGFKITSDNESAEIFYLLYPEQWGQGFMVEACDIIIDQVSNALGLCKIYALILPENIRAQKVACKLNFKYLRTILLLKCYGQKKLVQQWLLIKNF